MAQQVALSAARAGAAVFQPLGDGIGEDDRGIEVDQMGVVDGRSLGGADAVGIVADRAWRAVVDDVLAMVLEKESLLRMLVRSWQR